jgi:lipopolysaccharide transport system permease protein
VSAVPAHYRAVYFLNPLSGLLEAFRWSLLGTGHLDGMVAACSALAALVIFAAGALAFKRMERTFADVI